MNKDIESVLFLIGVHANINSRVHDSKHLTPLHLAVDVGSEIIVRNLVSTPYGTILNFNHHIRDNLKILRSKSEDAGKTLGTFESFQR